MLPDKGPVGVAFLAPWRLGERLKKAATTENAIAKEIVEAAFRIRTTLGPGPAYDIAQRGLQTVSRQAIPVVYGTIRIDIGFREHAKKTSEATRLSVLSV